MRSLGLHLRLQTTMLELASQALQLHLKTFQSFCVVQATNNILQPSIEDVNHFVELRHREFDRLYLHGSYWINLARRQRNSLYIFDREYEIAKTFEFTHMIIHPGSGLPGTNKSSGIDILAYYLNKILSRPDELIIMLENTTHSNLSVGSDLNDFALLLEKIDKPERLQFCIDSAHAYGYGYPVHTQEGLNAFINLVDEVVGLEKVGLLHINDTKHKLGSHIDHHAPIGQGTMGVQALQRIVADQRLAHVPIILEPPVMSQEGYQEQLALVRSWM